MFTLPPRLSGVAWSAALTLPLVAVVLQAAAPEGRAAVLYQEDFSSAGDGTVWNGFKGWTGDNNNQVIRSVGDEMRATFVGSPTTAATMSYTLGSEAPGATHGYRLSFTIVGGLHRPFLVMLGDANNDRVGLELGYTSSGEYGIGGVSIGSGQTYSQRVHYNPNTGAYGGYYSTTTAPANFSVSTVYKVSIDINGTEGTLNIGGADLAANTVRVIYNPDGTGGLDTFTTLFDLPANFSGISSLQMAKVVGTGLSWSVGDLELRSFEAVPEASALTTVFGAAAAFAFLKRLRNRK